MKQKFQRYINTYLYNIPYSFSIKNVIIKLIEKLEYALRSKSKNTAVHQKETKLNEKGRSASAIMSRRRCINHPQIGFGS